MILCVLQPELSEQYIGASLCDLVGVVVAVLDGCGIVHLLFGLVLCLPSEAPSFSTQRRLIENADSRLRQPQPGGREESACVVCARRFWKDELKLLFLFENPAGGEERPTGIDAVPGNQQDRLCRLLGVERYKRRWPHIDEDELRKSAVEHPYLPGQFLLLHKRRMPADAKDAALVCKECKGPLTSSTITLPRLSLANDLWMGAQPPALRNLASATKRLLPMTRACMQVVVLQPAHLQREERQHGFIGNTIFLPQARPSAVLSILPPKEVDMQDTLLFVLVGGQKSQVRGSTLLKAPRDEYTAAVECLRRTSPFYAAVEVRPDGEDVLDGCVLETAEDSALAQELMQKGPADAQGQESDEEKASANIAEVEGEDAQKEATGEEAVDRDDDSGKGSGW